MAGGVRAEEVPCGWGEICTGPWSSGTGDGDGVPGEGQEAAS